jgi:hypothetical protein
MRSVTLRDERDGADRRHLSARLGDAGDLLIEGQDLGPATGAVSDDGEYEWVRTVAAADVPALLRLLGAPPGADVLDVLEARFTGPAACELERLLRSGAVPSRLWTWSG